MPRKKAKDVEQTLDAPIQIRLAQRAHHRHEHEIDPYQSPPGSVKTLRSQPLDRPLAGSELALRDAARQEQRDASMRYTVYLDMLGHFGGNRVKALAVAYASGVDPDGHAILMPEEQVIANFPELLADVRKGLVSTSLADMLEEEGLDLRARVSRYRQHVYSDNPAASLKALEAVGELEGNRNDAGSFENYLRLVKQQGSK
jgi:hypothetical protein